MTEHIEQHVRQNAIASGNSTVNIAGRDIIVYLDSLRQGRPAFPSKVGDECPYPGLAAFGREQARWFFGRDRLVAELIARLDGCPSDGGPLMVVASSGAGKSSLLGAGLLPALEDGALPGSRNWPRVLLKPTADPMRALTESLATAVGVDPQVIAAAVSEGPDHDSDTLRNALAARGAGARCVLIVDQLEELFTQCEMESQRLEFLTAVTRLAAAGPDGQPSVALVVYGLRADFYARCADYPPLRTPLQHGQILVGPMSRDELREAIRYPVRDVGLEIDEGLIELLLSDLGASAGNEYEAGRLPLLAHALRTTWQQRRGHELTVDGYRETGRIHGAVATTAERVFERLDDQGQQAARHVFLQLVRIGDGTEDTRRRVSNADLDRTSNPATAVVLEAYAKARLLTQQQDSIEITHEVLLRAWPRLRHWVDTDRAGNLARQELEETAHAWDRDGRDGSRLLRGTRLEAARDWDADHRGELSLSASALLAASIRQRRRATLLRNGLLAGLLTLALVASVLAVVFFRQVEETQHARDEARSARDVAVWNQITAQADQLRGTDASLAAQLELTAYRMRASPELATKLVATASVPLATTLTASNGAVRSVALSPDGSILATGAQDGTVRLWHAAEPAQLTPLSSPATGQTGAVVALAFSPDGRTLASAGTRGAQLWSVADPARPTPLASLSGHVSAVSGVTFSPDGHTVASAGEDGTIRLWNVADPVHPASLAMPLTGHTGAVFAVAFSPDGHTLASVGNDHKLRLWNVANLARPASLATPPAGHDGPALSVAFSPDGRTLATGSQDRTVRLWNVADPARPAQLGQLTGHASFVWSVAFSPDGRMLASASHDHKAYLWNVTDPAHPAALGQALTGHTGPVGSATFGPGGRTLVTGSHDGTVRLWDIPRTVLTGHTDAVTAVAFSHDGQLLATGSQDRTVRLWNVADPIHPAALGQALTDFAGAVDTVAFSPDGRMLATGSKDHAVRLWNLADPAHPAPVAQLTAHTGYVWSVAFSPDGSTLASADDKGTVRLWNVTDPAHTAQVSVLTRHTGFVSAVAFSPDGHFLATGSGDRSVQLWDLDDLPPRPVGASADHTAPVWSVAFSRDGNTLASAGEDGTVQLWNTTDPQHLTALGSPLYGHANTVYSVAFSPDRQTLATAGQDARALLWNVSDPARPMSLGPSIASHTGTVYSVAFSPDGRTLATVGDDRTIQLSTTDASRAIQRICASTRSLLTPEQWTKYIPQLQYGPPCN